MKRIADTVGRLRLRFTLKKVNIHSHNIEKNALRSKKKRKTTVFIEKHLISHELIP